MRLVLPWVVIRNKIGLAARCCRGNAPKLVLGEAGCGDCESCCCWPFPAICHQGVKRNDAAVWALTELSPVPYIWPDAHWLTKPWVAAWLPPTYRWVSAVDLFISGVIVA